MPSRPGTLSFAVFLIACLISFSEILVESLHLFVSESQVFVSLRILFSF